MSDYTYVGQELDLFAYAQNWKRYWSGQIAPYVRGRVLEVGAGNGNNLEVIRTLSFDTLTCIEPDGSLFAELQQKATEGITARQIMSSDLAPDELFDAILYIDVLEHIEDDHAEFKRACQHLAPGGHLIVLCPAHQFLYSPFDKEIGHFRRYSKELFAALPREGVINLSIKYLDCVGFFASLANKMMLRKAKPTKEQVLLWDRRMVPVSRKLDPVVFNTWGKSVLGIWKRQG